MAALGHVYLPRIALVDQDGDMADGPILELLPMALRLFADMLGMMAEQCPVMLGQQNHHLTTQESAAFLNVPRPYAIKEVEAGRLKCRQIGRQCRVDFTELRRYQGALRLSSERALQELADLSQDLRLGYCRPTRLATWRQTAPHVATGRKDAVSNAAARPPDESGGPWLQHARWRARPRRVDGATWP